MADAPTVVALTGSGVSKTSGRAVRSAAILITGDGVTATTGFGVAKDPAVRPVLVKRRRRPGSRGR